MSRPAKRSLLSAGMLLCALCSVVQAVELGEKLAIHGYGNQDYFKSDGNDYLESAKGTWASITLALLFIATLSDRTKVWAQWHGSSESARIDWAFVDYQAGNDLTLRGGQIRLPMGLYNEERDVAFLQMSALRPALYQEPTEFVDESFRGASVVYGHPVGAGSLSWDAYVGQAVHRAEPETAVERFDRLTGGRVTYKTPIDGLRFMVSGYNSQGRDLALGTRSLKRVRVFSADYAAKNFDIKVESGTRDFFGRRANTYYLQAGYTLAEKWTPFIRYDYITTDKRLRNDPAFYQKTASVGVTYKTGSGVGLRVENHFNRGYALPVAAGNVEPGAGTARWNMLAASVFFVF